MNTFIDDKFDPVKRRIGDVLFDRVIGTSATAAAIVSAINRVPRAKRDEADQQWAKTSDVRKLYAQLSSMDIERTQEDGRDWAEESGDCGRWHGRLYSRSRRR